MAQGGPNDGQEAAPDTSRNNPLASRNLRYAAAASAALIIAVSVFALTRGGDDQDTEASLANANDSQRPGSEASVTDDPSVVTPTPVVAAASVVPAVSLPTAEPSNQAPGIVAPPPTPAALSTASPPDPTAAPTLTPTPVVGSPSTTTPTVVTPGPTTGLTPAAEDFARQIEIRHGVRIVRENQNWGATPADQMRNLTSVATALQSLPEGLVVAVADAGGGTLAVLSNNLGATEAGWQPYGNRAANFYTNEDQGPNGRVPSNQIVVQTGSTSQTIAHELVHGFQMRNIGPGQYALALLTDEMKSFMQATGWRQLASDGEIQANAFSSWADINEFFVYEGRPLDYINEHGTVMTLYAPNPMEAYAEAAGLYYARSFAAPLPDWPEYWDWFDGTLG